jgi:hypothetical protein
MTFTAGGTLVSSVTAAITSTEERATIFSQMRLTPIIATAHVSGPTTPTTRSLMARGATFS